jgi:hypothetical protein
LDRVCVKVRSGKGMAKPTGFVSARAKEKMRNRERKITPEQEISIRGRIDIFLSEI